MLPLVPVVAKQLLGFASSRFRSAVIERWTRYRSERFLEAFCEEVALDRSLEAQAALDAIFESETKSEALFEAYRSVALSKTKTVGPRAIGFLTAKLVNEGRTATEREADWGAFFESASDVEMIEAREFYTKHLAPDPTLDERITKDRRGVVIEWAQQTSSSQTEEGLDQTFNLHYVGAFAARLGSLGILEASVEQSLYTYEDDGKAATDATARYIIILRTGDAEFIEIIDRALRVT